MLTRYATDGAVAAANHLAASAGAGIMQRGANAVDAVIAAAGVMAVVAPEACGMGGDLFAVVAPTGEVPAALNASGRSGSGADPERLRADGFREMPFKDDVRAVTVPGFVDGLIGLHTRFATRELDELLAPAHRLADAGFPVSSSLAEKSLALPADQREAMFGHRDGLRAGRRLRLPRLADVLAAVAGAGRAGFYDGSVGRALLQTGAGEFSHEDMSVANADWVEPLEIRAFGRRLWTAPPNSQGYLALSSAWIADQVGLPEDPDDERWAFLLVEAARLAAFDRIDVLHEDADGPGLLAPARLGPRASALGEHASEGLADVYRGGGTTCICAVDRDRTGVSLITSNGAGFGSHLTLADHQIFLHNRGLGFSLVPGHPAEYGPRRKPPHTLTPLAVTDDDLRFEAVLGTMGGDAQPQISLQLLARALAAGQRTEDAMEAPRWVLTRDGVSPFHVWNHEGPPTVTIEHGAPGGWASGLRRRGYDVAEMPARDPCFGHAQLIRASADGLLSAASDPRSRAGGVVAS
ncbi:MAG TPA: gamma-glutamyltransferase [Solirubrobacteraceae bacterium]|nr:gamma-glutamyltransferase [Solirubrobacteraceae bacterium]